MKKNIPLIQGFFFLAAVVPVVVTVFTAFHFCLEIPRSDEWSELPLIAKAHAGTAGLSDFWAQHNEHRIFFPRLVLVPMALLSRWDLRFEVAVNLLLALGSFGILLSLVRREKQFLGERNLIWLPAALSILVFSLRQGENWIWGIEMVIFMAVFAVLAGLYQLSSPVLNGRGLAAAVLFGTAASTSFGAGLLIWPAGLFVLSLRETERREKIRSVLTWLFAGAAVTGIYFYGYVKPPLHPSLSYGFQHPGVFFSYVFKYLGSLISAHPSRAFAAGASGTFAFVTVFLFLFFRGLPKRVLAAAAAPGIFVLLTAVLTALSRSGFSDRQAMAERYVTISCFFWVSLLLLLALAARECEKNFSGNRVRGAGQLLPLCLCALVAGHAAWTSQKSYQGIKSLQASVHLAGKEIVLNQPWISYDNLYPKRIELEWMLETLKDLRFNIFDPAHQARFRKAVERPAQAPELPV